MATNMKERLIKVENAAEEKASGALNQVQELGRKSLYAYLGMWRMIYDGAMDTVDSSKRMFNSVVERGAGVEQMAVNEAQEVVAQAETRVNQVQNRVRKTFRRSEQELEGQIEAILQRLDVPTRANVLKLNANIEALNKKINTVITAQTEGVVERPLPRYDELTAKEIVNRLDALTIDELVAVKQYEMAHENRVTVLREVDRRLQAMPIARYDALTVDEIEPMLATLDAEQLQAVAAYEAAHENRVTLLRSIESELEARETAAA